MNHSDGRAGRKSRWIRRVQKYGPNQLARAFVWLGTARGHVVLETRGRKTGKVRRVPVAYGRTGNIIWIIAEHGRHADFVQNIEVDPAVRVRIGRRWHSGTAALLPHDDARTHIGREIGRRHGAVIRLLGSNLMTVRIVLAAR